MLKLFMRIGEASIFLSQSMHNTKVLSVGDVFVCGVFFPKIYTEGVCR